ncbi:MAG TPA: hypothetical protein PLJ47_03885 [Candidatus Hydrogenedentes bacterium]|nr:hypothetical protein [Candidatus Hydrogenedentota bacterium]HRK33715.1 hypothetical protein [Candidatus Hydrogenedentota bacterium]
MPALGYIFCILGALSILNGIWMIGSAPTWFENLPGRVADFGPYNGHFIRDIGLAYLISGIGFVWSAFHLRACRPIIIAQAFWAGGHALLHVADMIVGRVGAIHWILDFPGVLFPGVVLGVLVVPRVWRIANPASVEVA